MTQRKIIGRSAAFEVALHLPKTIKRAYLSQGKHDARGEELRELLTQKKVRIELIHPQQLRELVDTEQHQGVVLEVESQYPLELTNLIHQAQEAPYPLLLLLDGIEDPHNLGAILRVAEVFGVQGVVWSKNKGVGVTPSVTKVASGATELVPWCHVSNLGEAIRRLKKEGFWIVTSELSDSAANISSFSPAYPLALVIGAEGEGVSKLVKDLSDFQVMIPMFGKLQSLNAAQATSVLLYALRSKT